MKKIINKQNFATDIDDSICSLAFHYINFLRKLYPNVDIPNPKTLKKYYDERNLGISRCDIDKAFDQFAEQGYYKKLKPYSWAIKTLCYIQKHYNLYIITSRHPGLRELTFNWFAKYGIYPIDIFFATQDGGSKAEIVQRENIKFMVEDRQDTSYKIAREGCKVYLFGQPYNKNYIKHPLIKRVQNWREIFSEIKAL